jgi:cytochrome c oxidase cbb3-type subunit 3
MKKILFTFTAALLASAAFASDGSGSAMGFHDILIAIIVVLSIVMLMVVYTLKQVVTILKHEATGKAYTYEDESLTAWERILSLKPLAAEKDIDLGHDYDGIRELNNPIPPWFNVLFYGTIIFAIGYLIIYHITDSAPLQAAEYKNELIAAEKQKEVYLKMAGNAIDENTVQLVIDKALLASAEQEYLSRCAACHGQKGEGGVGPNLTDEYWLHGGSINDVFKTIKYGVPAKGMVAWQNAINPVKMQELASYILSLQGTNPAGGKEPQGEKYTPAETASSAESSSTSTQNTPQ